MPVLYSEREREREIEGRSDGMDLPGPVVAYRRRSVAD
jgi:hypothetical protein